MSALIEALGKSLRMAPVWAVLHYDRLLRFFFCNI